MGLEGACRRPAWKLRKSTRFFLGLQIILTCNIQSFLKVRLVSHFTKSEKNVVCSYAAITCYLAGDLGETLKGD